jgi:hypothetical protein
VRVRARARRVRIGVADQVKKIGHWGARGPRCLRHRLEHDERQNRVSAQPFVVVVPVRASPRAS